jgi:hypothetical protein
MTIAQYFEEKAPTWDRLDCLAFIDCLTDLISAYSADLDWQNSPLYQKWLRHRYARFMPSADETFTMGDYHNLVSTLITILHTIGIK